MLTRRTLAITMLAAIAGAACSATTQPSTTMPAPLPTTSTTATPPPTTAPTRTTTVPPETTTTLPPNTPYNDFDLARRAVLDRHELPEPLRAFLPAQSIPEYPWLIRFAEPANSYFAAYEPAHAGDNDHDIASAFSSVLVLPTEDAAADRLAKGLEQPVQELDYAIEAQFGADLIGDSTIGVVLSPTSQDGWRLHWETRVAFVSGRIVGMVGILHEKGADHTELAMELARRLRDRIVRTEAGEVALTVRDDDYYRLAWTPTHSLEAFSAIFTVQLEGDFPGGFVQLMGSGTAIGGDRGKCRLNYSQYPGGPAINIVRYDGAFYLDTGEVYEHLTPDSWAYDYIARCPVFTDFWQSSGLSEPSLAWGLDDPEQPTIDTQSGSPQRHYELSHLSPESFLFTRGFDELRQFEVWYPVDGIWPARLSLDASGNVSQLLGAEFATDGTLTFDMTYTLRIQPQDPSRVRIDEPDIVIHPDPTT